MDLLSVLQLCGVYYNCKVLASFAEPFVNQYDMPGSNQMDLLSVLQLQSTGILC